MSFEAGALERVEGTIALVDLGQNAFNTEHGARGRMSEDMHFAWNQHARGGGERDESGSGTGESGSASTTGAFSIPARAATASVRALVQLTHVAPAAGGIDPKVYTRKSDKEIAAHLTKEKKRLDKGTPPGTFASGGEPPKGIIAWAVLPIMAKGRAGVVDGIVAVDSMYRVKEAYTEAILLEAAAATARLPHVRDDLRRGHAFRVVRAPSSRNGDGRRPLLRPRRQLVRRRQVCHSGILGQPRPCHGPGQQQGWEDAETRHDWAWYLRLCHLHRVGSGCGADAWY